LLVLRFTTTSLPSLQHHHTAPDFGHDNLKQAIEGSAKLDIAVSPHRPTPDFGHDNAKGVIEGTDKAELYKRHNSIKTPNFGTDNAKLGEFSHPHSLTFSSSHRLTFLLLLFCLFFNLSLYTYSQTNPS
jgi:hypothetical protein